MTAMMFAPDGFKAKVATTRVTVDDTNLIKKPSSLFMNKTHESFLMNL